jgi:hypothetical protein
MRLGIDFDNTIICYDEVFAAAARSRGWIGGGCTGTKKQVRDAVRLLDEGEAKWQMLQAEVYAKRMAEASPFPGVLAFLQAARARNWGLFIVSHKTRHSAFDPHKTDLRAVAIDWMERHRLLDPEVYGLSRERVFFADTREEKVARIAALECTAFIDDLQEVFEHADFPSATQRILFSPDSEPQPNGSLTSLHSWQEIGAHVLSGAAVKSMSDVPAWLIEAGARIAGETLVSAMPMRPGGNNRLFKVETRRGKTYALKSYVRDASDPRDRLGQEFDALCFLAKCDEKRVPRPIGFDEAAGCAVYEWIDGTPPGEASAADIDQLSAFLLDLQSLRQREGATTLRPASASFFSPAAAIAQFDARLHRLRGAVPGVPDLDRFLDGELIPTARQCAENMHLEYGRRGLEVSEELPLGMRALSPSDFGLHNTLRRRDGSLAFVDFEYFGWDDPAKMLCDVQLHPGSNLPHDARQRVFDTLAPGFAAADPTFIPRYKLLYPLLGMIWCLIILNELLPERFSRRTTAGRPGDTRTVHARQIARARRFHRALMEMEHELAAV